MKILFGIKIYNKFRKLERIVPDVSKAEWQIHLTFKVVFLLLLLLLLLLLFN